MVAFMNGKICPIDNFIATNNNIAKIKPEKIPRTISRDIIIFIFTLLIVISLISKKTKPPQLHQPLNPTNQKYEKGCSIGYILQGWQKLKQ